MQTRTVVAVVLSLVIFFMFTYLGQHFNPKPSEQPAAPAATAPAQPAAPGQPAPAVTRRHTGRDPPPGQGRGGGHRPLPGGLCRTGGRGQKLRIKKIPRRPAHRDHLQVRRGAGEL